ncbi:MAG: cyclodeaminase/cyclohydrolase family protein [bacterium]
MLTELSLSKFLDELASHSPAPGGGSVAALSGAIGAALTSMICNLTIGKKKYADVEAEMKSVLTQSEQLRKNLEQVIDEDTEAFNKVMAAFGLPKATEEDQKKRSAAIQEATKGATLVPLKVMSLCEQALRLTKTIAEKGNKNSASDAGVSALMLHAASAGAALNVRINLGGLEDKDFVKTTAGTMEEITIEVETLSNETLTIVNAVIGQHHYA